MSPGAFNEGNTAEALTVRAMAGVDWTEISAEKLGRSTTDILLEDRLRAAIIRLNPGVSGVNAESLILDLRRLCAEVPNGLVSANEEFAMWLRGEKSKPFGESGRHVTVKLIDFEHPENNSWIVARQVRYDNNHGTDIFDTVGWVNGMPLIIGEAKSPVRNEVSWVDGARDIIGGSTSAKEGYQISSPGFFVPNLLSFGFDGKELGCAAVATPVEDWSPWRPMENGKLVAGLSDGRRAIESLTNRRMVLDLLHHFTLYGAFEGRRIKLVARYQQVDAVNRIVERVCEGEEKQGLIWHFQGSGKTLVMLFAAQAIRLKAELRNPPVLVVVDRLELDTQTSGVFRAHDVSGFMMAKNQRDLSAKLRTGAKYILITTIQRFEKVTKALNDDGHIVVLVDEAHRSQEGDFGERMRRALPNAFLFGLTGTPINRIDHNTFRTFGGASDEDGYLSKYSFSDSVRDKATVPIRFEPREVKLRVERDLIDSGFEEIADGLRESDKAYLSKKAVKYLTIAEDEDRIAAIAADVKKHFEERVRPHGFKAMLVAPSRKACVRYKDAFDRIMPASATEVVMSSLPAGDPKDWHERFDRNEEAETAILQGFRKSGGEPQILIVTARLLTGFDAKILQAIYVDKPMREQALLQAVCRANRPFTSACGERKQFALIVDYVGIFDDVGRAFAFDESEVKKLVRALAELRDKIRPALEECSAMLSSVDRTQVGWQVLEAADVTLGSPERREAFARKFVKASRMWEALHPDDILYPLEAEYRWLAQIYQSLRASSSGGDIIWERLGAKTIELIQRYVGVEAIRDDLEPIIVDPALLEKMPEELAKRQAEDLERRLGWRISLIRHDPRFVPLSERLDQLKRRAEMGMLSSIEFLKELLRLAKDVVAEEQARGIDQVGVPPKDRKAALTDLFLATRTDKTPDIVRRIVDRIDEIVQSITGGFTGWQQTDSGTRRVKQAVLRILLDYQLHKDEELKRIINAYIQANY